MTVKFLLNLTFLFLPCFLIAQTRPVIKQQEKPKPEVTQPVQPKLKVTPQSQSNNKVNLEVLGEITSPINNTKVIDRFTVSGTVKNLPKKKYLWLLNCPEESAKCWPQFKNIECNPKTGLFEAMAEIGGKSNLEHKLKLVYVDYESHVEFINFISNGNVHQGLVAPKDVQEIASVTVVKIDKPAELLYGVTKEGIFFIHRSLVEKVGGNSPLLRSELTSWEKDEPMELNSQGYYIASIIIEKPLTRKIDYCYRIGDNKFIPHALINVNSALVKDNDCINNGNKGYNFSTMPLEVLPF